MGMVETSLPYGLLAIDRQIGGSTDASHWMGVWRSPGEGRGVKTPLGGWALRGGCFGGGCFHLRCVWPRVVRAAPAASRARAREPAAAVAAAEAYAGQIQHASARGPWPRYWAGHKRQQLAYTRGGEPTRVRGLDPPSQARSRSGSIYFLLNKTCHHPRKERFQPSINPICPVPPSAARPAPMSSSASTLSDAFPRIWPAKQTVATRAPLWAAPRWHACSGKVL